METIPNHVRNVLTFKHLKPLDKKAILNRITRELEDDIYPLNRIIDFDKIIPEPRTESECPDDFKVNKDSHVMEDKERPWFDWYAWHNRYWGTKWNAYDGRTTYVYTDRIECMFNTAWSPPMPIYEQMAEKYPNFEWEVKYADECGGDNCGHIIHDKGETTCVEIGDMSNDEIYNEVWGEDE